MNLSIHQTFPHQTHMRVNSPKVTPHQTSHYRDFQKPWLQFQVGHIVEQVLAGVNKHTVIESVKTLISPKFTKAQLFKHGKCLLYEGINNIISCVSSPLKK